MKINDVPQSGSVAGVTSSRNRSGQYRRTRAVPVNPNTAAQSAVRAALASLAAAWRTLTSSQQLGWVAYADAHPRVNPLGVTYKLTGMQAFVGVNGELIAAGLDQVLVAPVAETPDAPVLTIGDDTVSNLEIGFTPQPVPADMVLIWQSSPPRSRGVLYNSDFRTVNVFPATTGAPWQAAEIAGKFGEIDVTKRYFLRAKFVTEDGQSGAWSNILILDPQPEAP